MWRFHCTKFVLFVKCSSSLYVLQDSSPGLFTRYTRQVPLVEQELFPFRSTWFTPDYLWGSCYSILSFMCMFCRSLLILFSFFFWPLCCLFLFDIRILITPMVSSNFSLKGVSRSVHSRTVRRKQTKRQIMVNKTLHRKLTMGQEAPG